MVGELIDAHHRLEAMVAAQGASSVRQSLLGGPEKNWNLFSRDISALEKSMQEVAGRIQGVAEKRGGTEDECAQVIEASRTLRSATDLLQKTREAFHIREYSAHLPLWKRAVINVKKFIGWFTKTRYAKIDASVVDVQKIAVLIQSAIGAEFEKTLPPGFAHQHRVAVSLAGRKIEPPQAVGHVEVTEQGELQGTVGGAVVTARTWRELGERIDEIRRGIDVVKEGRAALMKELADKTVDRPPGGLPEGTWYIQKRGDEYAFCQQGLPDKVIKITGDTKARSVNELFGVSVSDSSFIHNVLWEQEKRVLEELFRTDAERYTRHGQLLNEWLSPREAAATYLFFSPGELEGEKERPMVQIGIGETKRSCPIEIDEGNRQLIVRDEDHEHRFSSVEELHKKLAAGVVHGEEVHPLSEMIEVANEHSEQGKKALEEFARITGGELPEMTQEAVEREVISSPVLQGLAQQGLLICRPWKKEGNSFLTVLKDTEVATFPLDCTRHPGKIVVCKAVDQGGDVELAPFDGEARVKEALQNGFSVQGVLWPSEYMEIRKLASPLRDEIAQLSQSPMGITEFYTAVHALGKNAAYAYVVKEFQDRLVGIVWWDGEAEHDLYVDFLLNPGKLTVSGKTAYQSWDELFKAELGRGKERVIPPQRLMAIADERHTYCVSQILRSPLFVEKDPTRDMYAMVRRLGVPQVWWIGRRGEHTGPGIVGRVVKVLKKGKDMLTGEKEPLAETLREKFSIKVCLPDGQLQEIHLRLIWTDGRWKLHEGGQAFDTLEELLQARGDELGIDRHYNHRAVDERYRRLQAMERDIESSGIGTGAKVFQAIAGVFVERVSDAFFEGKLSHWPTLCNRLKGAAAAVGHSVGCVVKVNDQYRCVVCAPDGEYSIGALEIDTRGSTTTLGFIGGKKFDSFSAFRAEALLDVVALCDAEREVKRAQKLKEKAERPTPIASEPPAAAPEPSPTIPMSPSAMKSDEAPAAEPVRPSTVMAPSGRPSWLDTQVSWVTVGRGKRLDQYITRLIRTVDDSKALRSCKAGHLDNDERVFHAWVKALGKSSDKLSEQDVERLEGITKELPLIERLWLLEVAVNPKIISGQRQDRAIKALKKCLKANIRQDEEALVVRYLKANGARYGNAKTREEAINWLLAQIP